MKIGLTGLNCSGKGEVAKILMEQGFEYFSLSDIIREEIKERGLVEDRETLISVANDLRKNFGSNILAKRTNEKIKNKDKVVIDSIRNEYEVNELRKNKDFILLCVEAPIELRFERAVARGRVENASTVEEFKRIDEKESTDDPVKQQLSKVGNMADYKIKNNSSLDSLKKNVDEFLIKLG